MFLVLFFLENFFDCFGVEVIRGDNFVLEDGGVLGEVGKFFVIIVLFKFFCLEFFCIFIFFEFFWFVLMFLIFFDED